MILDCSEMDVPVAMIHVAGTMLYPKLNDQRRSWITWSTFKMLQQIEYRTKYSSNSEMIKLHLHFGNTIGMLALNFGGFSTFAQNIYANPSVYTIGANDERAKIGKRAGTILETALANSTSINQSTEIIFRDIEIKNEKYGKSIRLYDPKSEAKNTWNDFSSVAHLWAAANKHWHSVEAFHSMHLLGFLASLFVSKEKCLTELSDKFDAFLNTADHIRLLATSPSQGQGKRKKPILDRDSTWDVLNPHGRDNDTMVFFMEGMQD